MNPEELLDLAEREWKDLMTFLRIIVDVEYGSD